MGSLESKAGRRASPEYKRVVAEAWWAGREGVHGGSPGLLTVRGVCWGGGSGKCLSRFVHLGLPDGFLVWVPLKLLQVLSFLGAGWLHPEADPECTVLFSLNYLGSSKRFKPPLH